MRSRFIVAAFLLAGCPRELPDPDSGIHEIDAGNADAGPGNTFDDPIVINEARVRAVDPALLRQGSNPCREPVLVRIYNVVDGDTVDARGEDVVLDAPVRMIGIDTPEVAHSGNPADCYGNEAAAFTGQLEDQLVWLSFDEECFDRFNRLLAYVHVGPSDGDLWERQLLRRGFATVFTIAPNDQYASVFNDDENQAQADNVGVWSVCF